MDLSLIYPDITYITSTLKLWPELNHMLHPTESKPGKCRLLLAAMCPSENPNTSVNGRMEVKDS